MKVEGGGNCEQGREVCRSSEDPSANIVRWPITILQMRIDVGQPTLPDIQKARAQRRPDPFVQAETRKIDLRDVWVQRVGNLPNIEVLTPEDSGLHVGVTSFRLKGKPASWVQQTLLSKYRILTATRKGIAGGDAVRVTPSLYTNEGEIERFGIALRELSKA